MDSIFDNIFTKLFSSFVRNRVSVHESIAVAPEADAAFDTDGIAFDSSLPLEELILSVERQIQKSPVEVGIVFNLQGEVLVKHSGEAGRIVFYGDELRQMADNILTHNHPNCGYFSKEDVFFAHEVNLAELRAVAGRKVHRLIRPLDGWDMEELTKRWNSEERKILHKYNQNKLNRDEAKQKLNQLPLKVVELLSLKTQHHTL